MFQSELCPVDKARRVDSMVRPELMSAPSAYRVLGYCGMCFRVSCVECRNEMEVVEHVGMGNHQSLAQVVSLDLGIGKYANDKLPDTPYPGDTIVG